jgi:hypothetical protein
MTDEKNGEAGIAASPFGVWAKKEENRNVFLEKVTTW